MGKTKTPRTEYCIWNVAAKAPFVGPMIRPNKSKVRTQMLVDEINRQHPGSAEVRVRVGGGTWEPVASRVEQPTAPKKTLFGWGR